MSTSKSPAKSLRPKRRPSRRETTRHSSAPRSAAQPTLAGAAVLLVEDDPASSKLAALVLTDAGAFVHAATSAEEALLLLTTLRPHIIIVDLVLPRMGGLVFVEQLKAAPPTQAIPILAVTSLNGPEAERIALAAGCAAYLRKPIDTETFAAEVAAHLWDESR